MNHINKLENKILDEVFDSITKELVSLLNEVATKEDISAIQQLLLCAEDPKHVITEQLVSEATKYLISKFAIFKNQVTNKELEINCLKTRLATTERHITELLADSLELQETLKTTENSRSTLALENTKFGIFNKKIKEQLEILERQVANLEEEKRKLKNYANQQANQLKLLHIEEVETINKNIKQQLEILEHQVANLKEGKSKSENHENQQSNPLQLLKIEEIETSSKICSCRAGTPMSVKINDQLNKLQEQADDIRVSYRKTGKNLRDITLLNEKREELRELLVAYNTLKPDITPENQVAQLKIENEIKKTLDYFEEKEKELQKKSEPNSKEEQSTNSKVVTSVSTIQTRNKQELLAPPRIVTPVRQQDQPELVSTMVNRFDIVNKRVIANIPKFEGGQGAHVEDQLDSFITNCDYVLESLDNNDEDRRIFFAGLKNRFEKDAYHLVVNANVTTYEQLKAMLNATYKPKKTMAEVNQAFYNCRQQSGERTSNYFRRLQTHLNDCKKLLRAKFPENNDALINNQELEAINIFKRGTTNAGLRQHLILNGSTTLADLEIAARAYEDAEKQITSGFFHEDNNAQVFAVNSNGRNGGNQNTTNNSNSFPNAYYNQGYSNNQDNYTVSRNNNQQRQDQRNVSHNYNNDSQNYNIQGRNYDEQRQNYNNSGQNYNYQNQNNQRRNYDSRRRNYNNRDQNYNNERNYQRQGYQYPTNSAHQNSNNQGDYMQNDYSQNRNVFRHPDNERTKGTPICNLCGNSGHNQDNCALNTKMCYRCKSWDHTISSCPKNSYNINENKARLTDTLEPPRIYCDNCGACGHEIHNCPLPQRPSTSAGIQESGNGRVQVKDARTSAH